MTIKEKIERLEDFCNGQHCHCDDCVLKKFPYCDDKVWTDFTDDEIDECYDTVFGGEQKEEINHPDRYAGGNFECIDVMIDVFGKESVQQFCILNAFKYIWRAEKKNGVEDIKKAVWYLNKYVELKGNDHDKN